MALQILNLTQHLGAPEQIAQGLVEPADKAAVQALLTFTAEDVQLGGGTEIEDRAYALTRVAEEFFASARKEAIAAEKRYFAAADRVKFCQRAAAEWGEAETSLRLALLDAEANPRPTRQDYKVLIGGLPALMSPLVKTLEARGLQPVFAHSDRVSEDQVQPDGSTKKVAVFRHQFFYDAV